MLGFFAVAGMAMAILAAVTLLPARGDLQKIRDQQAVLARDVEVNNQLIEYNSQLIAAVKSDPLVIERLLMEIENYRRPGEVAISSPAPGTVTPLAQLLAARSPEATPDSRSALTGLADRLGQPRTRRGLLFLAGLLIALAMVCFGPATKRRS